MDTMRISVPDHLKDFIAARVSEGGFNDSNEYVCALIQADQARRGRSTLEAEVLKGIESGLSVPMTDDDWTSIRHEVESRCARRTAAGS
jgi:antitoxin ParD1/3/4